MAAQKKATVTQLIYDEVQKRALGNSKTSLKKVASDYVNSIGRDNLGKIADGAYLCKHTVERIADCEDSYQPRADTVERIFRYFNAEIEFNEVAIKPKFQNKPKE